MKTARFLLLIFLLVGYGCVPMPDRPSPGHLESTPIADRSHLSQQIPKPVTGLNAMILSDYDKYCCMAFKTIGIPGWSYNVELFKLQNC